MAIEHGRAGSEDCTVLMESNPGGLRRREYRSLQKQMCCLQFMTVSFCLACCLLTLMYHANPSGCKDNEMLKPPMIAMQKQTLGSNSSEETSHEPKPTPFIRVTTRAIYVSGEGYVTWRLPGDHVNHIEFFSLDSDGESLIVHRGGTYKVSLQILYRGVQEQRSGQTLLSHEIRRYTAGYPIPLTMLVYKETINFMSHMWRKTLFSEGVYSLEAGDRLKVWSENRSLIDGSSNVQQTFFVAHPHFFS
ncbi:uncharacterized protein si:ch211-158d24.4 isoform X1 [Triplophysa rosa]|uniref:uncharacterized protein si:ch211-158d24.4 isoform X1 n=1 Tax=Triplophysa rosa TaxID=992332 RepID=UPI002545DCF4|nr:uncharacterized protein si:ch211-158d24.4 isoform X1 [Triplophysa rosa]